MFASSPINSPDLVCLVMTVPLRVVRWAIVILYFSLDAAIAGSSLSADGAGGGVGNGGGVGIEGAPPMIRFLLYYIHAQHVLVMALSS